MKKSKLYLLIGMLISGMGFADIPFVFPYSIILCIVGGLFCSYSLVLAESGK